MKRRDWLILAIVLAASLTLLLLRPGADTAAAAYLRITAPGLSFDQVPLTETRDIVIEQADGSRNVVTVFPGGFRMKESNCKNQDCIHQGDVTLANMAGRPLANQVICLPHKVVLELVTEAEKTVEITP